MRVLLFLLLSTCCIAQKSNADKIYTKSGRVLNCHITGVSEHEIFYDFFVNRRKYQSAILFYQVDSIYNGKRHLLPAELQIDTTTDRPAADSLPPAIINDLFLSAPVATLSLAQRTELAGYYLERSANQQLGALVTVAGSAIIGALLSNSAPEAGTGIFWAGATVACVLEVSAIIQKRKAGRYLRNTY